MTGSPPGSRIVHTAYDLGVGLSLGEDKDSPAYFRSQWYGDGGRLVAVFEVPQAPEPYLVIEFELPEMVRLTDEFWPSTETSSARWGGDLKAFCRTVEGADYPTSLEWVRKTRPKAHLYQFVTSDECLEVISENPPKARLASAEQLSSYLETQIRIVNPPS